MVIILGKKSNFVRANMGQFFLLEWSNYISTLKGKIIDLRYEGILSCNLLINPFKSHIDFKNHRTIQIVSHKKNQDLNIPTYEKSVQRTCFNINTMLI